MATIANLAIGLTAKTGPFTKGMLRAGSSVAGFAKRIAVAGLKMGVFAGGLAAVAGAAGLVLLVRKQLSAIDATAKLADRIGATTEELTGLRHAAELAGVASSSLDKSLEQLTRRLGEAKTGIGLAGDTLELLGLSAADLARKSPVQAFSDIADKIAALATQADRAQAAYNLFGRQGVALLNTLSLGKKGLAASAREAEKLGLSYSRIDAAQIEQANDAIVRLKALFSGIARAITIELSPFLTAVTTQFVEFGTAGTSMAERVRGAVRTLVDRGLVVVIAAMDRLPLLAAKAKLSFLSFTADAARSFAIMANAISESPLGRILGLSGARTFSLNLFKNLTKDVAVAQTEFARLAASTGTWSDSLERARERLKSIREGAAAIAKSQEDLQKRAAGSQSFEELLAAQKKLAERMKMLIALGKSVFESTRTPLEKYEAEIGKLNTLVESGAIVWDTYSRAVALARRELEGLSSIGAPATAALERGTAEALSASRTRSPVGGGNLALDRLVLSQEDLLDVNKEQLAVFREALLKPQLSLP